MKKILVPLASRRIPADSFAPVHLIRGTHITKLVKYGLLPCFVTPEMPTDMVSAIYKETQGVYLLNGNDLDPKTLGTTRHPSIEFTMPELDQLELGILARALPDTKPILGICRGCQVLAVASGGSIIPHLPDLSLGETHDQATQAFGGYEALRDNSLHTVLMDESSGVYTIVGKREIVVSTGHHQAIGTVGPNFRVAGRSPAGVIELIEHANPEYPFCIGVQSHPEVFDESDLEPLYAAFARAVGEFERKTCNTFEASS